MIYLEKKKSHIPMAHKEKSLVYVILFYVRSFRLWLRSHFHKVSPLYASTQAS